MGVQYLEDGAIIEGIFANGHLEGRGRCIHADGSVFEGNFK